MKIVFVTVSVPAIRELVEVGKYINKRYENILNLKLYYAYTNMDRDKRQSMVKDIENSDLVFVDLMGSDPDVISTTYIGLDNCKGNVVPYGNSGRDYMKLGKFTMAEMGRDKNKKGQEKKMDMGKMKKMMNMSEMVGKVMPGKMRDMRNYSLIMKYFKVGDYNNILNMIYLILRDYGGYDQLPIPEDPVELEDICLCDPSTMKYFKNYKEFEKLEKLDKEKSTVALLFYGHRYPMDTTVAVNQIRLRLKKFANVIPIAVSESFGDDENNMRKLLIDTVPVKIDCIINFMSFRLFAGPMGGDTEQAVELLKDIDAPYMKPFFMSRRTEEQWRQSVQGATTSEVMISVMLPELDGAIETIPIGAMADLGYSEDFKIQVNEIDLIKDRLEALVNKVKNYTELGRKRNKDKKVAIICYNYPPGEANIFGGAFLDTFESVANILKKLKEEGYNTSGMDAKKLKTIFTAGKLVNSGKYGNYWDELIKYDDTKYKRELMESKDFKSMLDDWGKSPGEIMTKDGKFLIPGIVDGNIFIGLQPARGANEDDKSYHDKSILPHHQYLGFYKYLREEFKADALMHIGTHGTLEFQKGKECGMSNECYPDILIGNKPHIYIYYSGNPSEATIAKRRSHANIVSYQPPVFIPGELYGDYSKLMTLVDNYRQSLTISPQGAKEILEDIFKMVRELNLEENLDYIEGELYRMKTSLIPEGLHILGEGYSKDDSHIYAQGILRHSLSGTESIRKLMARYKRYDMDNLLESGQYETINEIDKLSDKVFLDYLSDNSLKDWDIDPDLKGEVIKALKAGIDAAESSRENKELDGIIRILDGRYNPA
ncbi:MAG: cobaltochelatase subunit CobN, partial [Senegalia sp. (in: firmicutes)]